jgi:hypothetical protein
VPAQMLRFPLTLQFAPTEKETKKPAAKAAPAK